MDAIVTHTISNFSELHQVIKENCLIPSYWQFRGQSDVSWSLVPRCARSPYKSRDDKRIFSEWKQEALDVVEHSPIDDWHWLALAQQHGLATRLLDWSRNPLVAAFFASYENMEKDGVIFAYLGSTVVLEQSFAQSTPWEAKEPSIFRPSIKSRRVSNQSGQFTLSNEPLKCFTEQIRNSEKLFKLVIAKDYKKTLQLELARYQIHWGTLFPDLDGHSKFCNWQIEYGEKYINNQSS